jgi:hypothetical protein
MITCIKCRQKYSEQDHECLDMMTLEELMRTADKFAAMVKLDNPLQFIALECELGPFEID